MFFKDIIGQEKAKRRLINEIKEGRIPHAQLFCGPEGVGKLPLAIAYARYINCQNPSDDDACGTCPNCIKFNKLIHPDLHFVFPVVKKKGASKPVVCDDYISTWRQFVLNNPYFTLNQWTKEMGVENQQAIIYSNESDEILKKLSFKSSQGGYKSVIIWLPEKMNIECSNKLLKILEEPPSMTIFLLISEQPDTLLTTILSRCQRFNLPAISEYDMTNMITNRFGIGEVSAKEIAHASQGSVLKAIDTIQTNDEHKEFFDLFVSLMRLCYARKIREMKLWSETLASMGRERQKNFLTYCQNMIRENFIYNFHKDELNYMSSSEKQFSQKFAPFINEKNIFGIMNELSEAQSHIEQNVNAKMVFFDFSLKMIVLLIQK